MFKFEFIATETHSVEFMWHDLSMQIHIHVTRQLRKPWGHSPGFCFAVWDWMCLGFTCVFLPQTVDVRLVRIPTDMSLNNQKLFIKMFMYI